MSHPKLIRKRLSPSRGDGISKRSSSSSMSQITPPKRKTLKILAGKGPRFSRCQQPVIVSGRDWRRRGSSDSDSSFKTEPKLSLQEALQTFADESTTIQPYAAPPRRMTKRIVPSFTFHRPRLTHICSKFVKDIRESQRLRITSPPRPLRPHPNKCPSPPEVMPAAQTKYPGEDEKPSYKTGHATLRKDMGTTHHNRGYRLLTDDLAAHEGTQSDIVTDSDHLRANFPLVQTASDRKYPCLGLWYQAHDSSFSTLSATASKLALRPSPLHLGRDDASQDVPPTPVRSPLRSAVQNAITYPAVKALSMSSTRTRTRSSSYTTASVYSNDENSTVGEETPSSSSPPIPSRSDSVLQSMIEDASSKADQAREELGFVDDAYNMFADGAQNRFKEGLTPEYVRPVRGLTSLSREQTEKLSRTQRRVAKERARLLAAQRLTSDKAVSQDTEFGLWLHTAAAQSWPACHSQIHESQAREAMEQSREEKLLESPPSEIPEDAQLSTLYEYETSPSTPRKQPTGHETCNEQPLVDEESTLSIKADSSSEDQPNTGLISRRCEILSPSTRSKSSSGSQEDLDLLNFRRFEILWKGRKYPVLISEGGNIREGPCLHVGCQQHGKGLAESAHGLF